MRNPVVVIVPPCGFPGQAFLSFVERLREHDIPFVVASRQRGRCVGTGDVVVTAVYPWDDPSLDDAPAFVLFDDSAGTVADSPRVRALLRTAARDRRLVAGIGDGVFALAEAGLLRGRPACAANREAGVRLARYGALPMERVPRVLADSTILTAAERAATEVADELDSFRGVPGNPRVPV